MWFLVVLWFLATFSGQHAIPRWGSGLEVSCPDRDCSQRSTAVAPVAVRSVNVASRTAQRLRNRIKPKIPVSYVSKVRRILIASELVVPTSQTSGRARIQGNGNSRLLGAINLRKQRILKVNSLETARNPTGSSLLSVGSTRF